MFQGDYMLNGGALQDKWFNLNVHISLKWLERLICISIENSALVQHGGVAFCPNSRRPSQAHSATPQRMMARRNTKTRGCVYVCYPVAYVMLTWIEIRHTKYNVVHVKQITNIKVKVFQLSSLKCRIGV